MDTPSYNLAGYSYAPPNRLIIKDYTGILGYRFGKSLSASR